MIALDVQQKSEEWQAARLGIPTASSFDKIVTSKGELSKQAEKYMYQLATERVTGKKLDAFQSEAMLRGCETEDAARAFYELTQGVEIKQIGIAYRDEQKLFAASPDGLIGDEGLIELKCPLAHTHVEYLLNNKLPTEYIPQVQGQLFITGRKWSDFVSYFPGLKPLIVRVNRDDAFIGKLEAALLSFCKELDLIVEKIKA